MDSKNIIESFSYVAKETGINKTNLATIIEEIFIILIQNRISLLFEFLLALGQFVEREHPGVLFLAHSVF